MSAIRIQMFGPFRVWRQGDLVLDNAWPTQKSKSLLKILLSEAGHLVSTDRLIEYLWPDLGVDKARNNLWVTVSQARRVLQPELTRREQSDYILRSAEGYSFDTSSDYWLDVDAFRSALAEARAATGWPAKIKPLENARLLYGGAYLEEDPYEEWTLDRREELCTAYIDLLADLAEAQARLGRYHRAAALCREALTQDRTRESIYQCLMTYHYRAGEQSLAIRAYEECRKILWDDLGVEPSPETGDLYQQILRRQLDNPVNEDIFPPADEGQYENARLATAEFVGRSVELGQLTTLVDRINRGPGSLALIEGEPGIGKSRLIQEVSAYAHQRGLPHYAISCYQIEQSTPFQPIIELIDQMRAAGTDSLFRSLPPASLAEIGTLDPEAARLVPNLSTPLSGLNEAHQARLFKALVELLAAAAGDDGLLLTIDDIHWADQASLSFFHHLARQTAKQRILLIMTYRADESAADLALSAFIVSLRREPYARMIRLKRLSLADIQHILAPLFPSSSLASNGEEAGLELATWLHQETDGNPFFLVTILQSLIEQSGITGSDGLPWEKLRSDLPATGSRLALPEALRDSVRERLRRLPASRGTVLETAAVIGRRFEFSTLEAVSRQNPLDLLESIDDLLHRDLLRENEDGRHYDFSHDKIREVVYGDMSRARRAYLHRQVADAIEQRVNTVDQEYTGTLAEHYVHAEQWEKAIYYLGLAAERARRFFAILEALGFYDRAIELSMQHPEAVDADEQNRLLEGRGETSVQAGEFETAIADLELALQAARQAGKSTRECNILVTLGVLYRREDEFAKAFDHLHDALECARKLGNERRVADTLYHLGTVVWSQGENRQAEHFHSEAVEICRKLALNDLIAAQALHGLGEARWLAGDFFEAYQLFHTSLELSRKLGDRGLENENLHNLGALHSDQLAANYRQAQAYLQMSLKLLDETSLPWHRLPTLFILGLVTGFLGDYEPGIRYIQDAIEETGRLHSPRHRSTALDFLGCLYRDLNLLELAEIAFEEGLDIARQAGIGFWAPRLQANLAITRIRRGDFSVENDLLASLETARQRGQDIHAAVSLQGLAELAVQRGEFNRAIGITTELGELAEFGMQEALAQAFRWRGEALLGLGDREAAKATLIKAVDLAGQIEKPRLAWEVHSALARAYTLWGEIEIAAQHSRKAETALTAIRRKIKDPELLEGLLLIDA